MAKYLVTIPYDLILIVDADSPHDAVSKVVEVPPRVMVDYRETNVVHAQFEEIPDWDVDPLSS